MIFTITLKDPDGFSDSVRMAAKNSVKNMTDPDEQDACQEIRQEKIWNFLDDFVSYQENITLEVDTDNRTINVLKSKE
jgi:hypothetical protein